VEALNNLTFEEWVYHVFDHPDAWYHALDSDYWDGPAATTVAYMTRLFEDPITPLEGFTDVELNRGFWYLVGSGGNMMGALKEESVPLADRFRCMEAFFSVFEHLFVPRCTPYLSHLDEPEVAPLNSICYMWWDVMPIGGSELNETLFSVIERELALDHPALQEGALHGLGHWHHYYPTRITSIIDAYLARYPNLRPELHRYALAARAGHVA
jgi:hypothetical protein